MTEHERPIEEAEDPADTHARTLAELIAGDAQRQRQRTAAAFGFDPDAQHEETDDAA